MVTIAPAVIWALLFNITGCQLHISVKPKERDVDDVKIVTIRCSLNLRQTKTDRVYSIMLKRRGMTVAVMLTDGVEMPDRQYTIEGTLSSTPPGPAYLQVTLSNITCSDRGNYSCIMAVRRSYKNLQLGPVSSPFTVIGRASNVFFNITPMKSTYAVGEVITFTCSALVKSELSEWSWDLSSPLQGQNNSCSYSEVDCLFSCTSSVSHYVTAKDKGFINKCGYKGNFRGIKLNVTTFPVTDLTTEASLMPTNSETSSPETNKLPTPGIQVVATEKKDTPNYYSANEDTGEREIPQKNILIYSFVSVFCFIFLCIMLYLFASECRRSRHHDGTNYNNHRSYTQRKQPREQSRLVLGSGSQCCHGNRGHRNHSQQFLYLVPRSENGNTSTLNRQFVAENDVENIYEEVGQSHVHECNNFTLESERKNRFSHTNMLENVDTISTVSTSTVTVTVT